MWILVFFLLTSPLEAAPAPATSTSALTRIPEAKFLSRTGFSFSLQNVDQFQLTEPSSPELALEMHGPQSSLITLRSQASEKSYSAEALARNLARDYSVYGFSVLQLVHKKNERYHWMVADLVHKEKRIYSRQYLLLGENSFLTLNCQGPAEQIRHLIELCNSLPEL